MCECEAFFFLSPNIPAQCSKAVKFCSWPDWTASSMFSFYMSFIKVRKILCLTSRGFVLDLRPDPLSKCVFTLRWRPADEFTLTRRSTECRRESNLFTSSSLFSQKIHKTQSNEIWQEYHPTYSCLKTN